MAEAQSRAVAAASHEQGLRPLQIRVAALCALTQIFDGYDTHAIGLAAPAMARAWALPPAAFANTFVLSSLGILIGVIVAGPVGDRFGRKPLIVVGLAIVAAASFASAGVGSLDELAMVRLATGLGIGATLPTTVALLSDYAPPRIRANAIMFMFAGNTLGGFLGGQLAGLVLPHWGWPAVFVVGALAPLALIPGLITLLPESPRFRVGGMERVSAGRGAPTRLFSAELAEPTIRLWTTFFANMLSMSLLTYWLPSILSLMGFEPGQSAFAASVASAGGLVATLPLAAFAARFGSAATLAASLAAGGGFVAAISLLDLPRPLLFVAIFCAGGGAFGSQLAANGVAATIYPAAIRATGVGWALGAGRVGAIGGPALAGVLLSLNWPPRHALLCVCAAALVAAAAANGLRGARGAVGE
jgi:AAHS family 4-hydroxybenzoate transporter-like MFS transporter